MIGHSPRPHVSASLIVRNEAQRILDCLHSIEAIVDEIVIVDTGSTDDTPQMAQAFSDKVRLFFHPWQDHYSEARNRALDACRGDWVLSIDGDEALQPTSRDFLTTFFQHVPETPTLCGIAIHHLSDSCGNAQVATMIRVFSRHPAVRFHGRIHEDVFVMDSNLPYTRLDLPQVVIHNHGYLDADAIHQKTAYRIKLLEKSLSETETNHPFMRYHYACSFIYGPNPNRNKALVLLQAAIDESIHPPADVPPTYRLAPLGWAIQEMFELLADQQKWDKMITLYPRYQRYIEQAGAFCLYGQALIQTGQDSAAEAALLRCLDPHLKPWRSYQGYDTWQPRALLLILAIRKQDLLATTAYAYQLLAWFPTGEIPGWGSAMAILQQLWWELKWNETVFIEQVAQTIQRAVRAASWSAILPLAWYGLVVRPDANLLHALALAAHHLGWDDVTQLVQQALRRLCLEDPPTEAEQVSPPDISPTEWRYPLHSLLAPADPPRLTVLVLTLEAPASFSRPDLSGVDWKTVPLTPENQAMPLSNLVMAQPGQWGLLLYPGETIHNPVALMEWCRYRAVGLNGYALRIESPPQATRYEVRLVPIDPGLSLASCLHPEQFSQEAPWEPSIHDHRLTHIWIEEKTQ